MNETAVLEQTISVARVTAYEQTAVTAAVSRHFETLGLNGELHPGMKVLIKPNLLMKRRPEEATTTHPTVVAGVVACLRNIGITDITIADSPGGPYTKLALDPIYTASGMRAVAEGSGAVLNEDYGSFERKNPDGLMVKSFTLINPVRDADYIIDVCKLKTHGMTLLSGAVKNLFGTVPGLMKPEFHWRFPEPEKFCGMLLDLCDTVRPNAVIVDAVVSMEGDGPSGGTPKDTGMLLAARNPYHMDLALCKVMKLNPMDVWTVRESIERGWCEENADNLRFVGDELRTFDDFQLPRSKSVDFSEHIPHVFRGFVDRFLVSRPAVKRNQCVGCGKCAESCPASTIQIQGQKAVIDYSNCIHCFCCHEMCPVRAIGIKRFRLFNW